MVQGQRFLADCVWVATSLLKVGVFKSPRHCVVVCFSLQKMFVFSCSDAGCSCMYDCYILLS